MINWDDYRFLLALEQTGSLSAAARALGVSQPTVSRRIFELERALGVALIERLPDGYRLSRVGQNVCQRARAMQQKSEEIQKAVRDHQDDAHHPVVITASEGIAQALLVPTLADLRASRSDLSVEAMITTRPVDLRRREADIALRVGDPRDDTLIARKVGAAEFGLYAPIALIEELGMPISEDDLARFPFIESTGEISHLPQANWLRLAIPPRMKAYSSNSILNQLGAFKAGLGLMTLPDYLVHALPHTVRVLPQLYAHRMNVRVMYFGPVGADQAVRAVLDFLIPSIEKRLKDSRIAASTHDGAGKSVSGPT